MGPSDGGWICVTHDEFKEDYISSCYSCGYLIGETKKEYKICGSYHKRGEDSINTIGLLGIPKVAVVSIKKL
jgi:hypothetical protein